MKTLRKPNGPRNVPAPKVLERWNVGDLVIRETPGEQPYFRVVYSIEGEWWADPTVCLRTPGVGVAWRGMLWSSAGQAREIYYSLSEAHERYRLCPDALIEEPF